MQHLKLKKVGMNLEISNLPKKIPVIKRSQDERKRIGNDIILKKDLIIKELSELNAQYCGIIKQALVFKIKTNHFVNIKDIESMGLTILSNEGNYATIVYSSDDHAIAFTDKINQYRGLVEGHKYPFLDAFDDLEPITPNEKIGKRLKERPLSEGDPNLLDIEFWPCSKEQMSLWANELEDYLKHEGAFVLRRYAADSYCFIRAFIPSGILDKILSISQVSRIDRPPKRTLQMEKISKYAYSYFENKIKPPQKSALGILIIDSGIMPNHPLLKETIKEFESFVPEEDGIDKCHHGSGVAGVALYGDLIQCLEDEFQPAAWLYSANVCDSKKSGYYDEDYIKEAIEYFLSNYEDIKIINISLGNDDDEIKINHKQFYLAAMIDEMIYKYRILEEREVIFIISSGNAFHELEKNPDVLNKYPDYLIDNLEFKIIDPGTSANALTVGSISRGEASVSIREKVVAGYLGFPSPFTRSGPCLKGVIKPEIVDIGGDVLIPGESIKNEPSLGVVVIENDFIKEGLLSVECGTSLSCAKVTNLVAKLWNKYPDYSSEMIKALVVNSARLPPVQSSTQMKLFQEFERPKKLESFADAMKVYGYGIPNYERALPEINRVLLLDQSEIELNKLVIYEVLIPPEFYEIKGPREISITLSFIPPTDAGSVRSYFGCSMEFELFRNISLNELKSALSKIEINNNGAEVETTFIPKKYLSKYKTPLRPSTTKRSHSSVQKAVWLMDNNPKIKSEILYLVIICKDKWIDDRAYKQPYSIVVTIEHSYNGLDLYTQIQNHSISVERISHLPKILVEEKA